MLRSIKPVNLPGIIIQYVRSKLQSDASDSLAEPINRDHSELDENSIVDEALAQLSDWYIVLKDYYCHNRSIDYIVIGPTGIFIIGVMIHRGTVERMGDDLLINNRRPTKDFIALIKRQMDGLHSLLKEKSGAERPLQPVLCFIHAYIKTRGQINGVDIIPVSELVKEITEQPVILDGFDIQRLAKCLQT